jgi:hypothetical protein
MLTEGISCVGCHVNSNQNTTHRSLFSYSLFFLLVFYSWFRYQNAIGNKGQTGDWLGIILDFQSLSFACRLSRGRVVQRKYDRK